MQTFDVESLLFRLTPAQVAEFAAFVPAAGRLVAYLPTDPGDPVAIKCGDGVTALEDLPFISGEPGPAGPAAAPESLAATTGTGNIALLFGAVRVLQRVTLTGAATLVPTNLAAETPAREGDTAEILVTGAGFSLALPSGTVAWRGEYDPGAVNRVRVTILALGSPVSASTCAVDVSQVGPAALTGMVMRQVTPAFFASENAALWTPAGTPATATLYSAMRDIEAYRNPDGTFHFRMVWPVLNQSISWRQRSNPVEAYEAVDGYEFVTSTGSPNLTGWAGLAGCGWPGAAFKSQPGTAYSTDSFGVGLLGVIGRLTRGNLVIDSTPVLPQVLFGPALATTTTAELYVDA
jgi:hypothetical protein